MPTVDLVMPKMGESIMEATILKWHKNPGDTVKMDETVLEIATDKVDSEVPSTAAGVITEVLFKVNDVVPIGTVIARISTEAGATVPAPQPAPQAAPTASAVAAQSANASSAPTSVAAPTGNGRFYSPLVLNIAAQEGISMTELESIPGTGNEGRVTKKDILQYVAQRQSAPSTSQRFAQEDTTSQRSVQEDTTSQRSAQGNAASVPSNPDGSQAQNNQLVIPVNKVESAPARAYSGNVEVIEMDRMRKLIADHMVRSKHTSPHVTSFTEADVTNLVLWRDRVKKEFEKREGTKITFTPLFIEAIVRCIKKFPLINSSIDGNNIIVKKDINIGMATALPSGNLIVPVIRNADQLNLVGLAKQVNGMADAARRNKLKPEDIADGTFTLTNVGTFGSLMGTPIINQPQVAILAVGAIKKRPVVIETPAGDSIAIRHMMYLSMSYDHRIVDGSLGATFLTAVAHELENFNPEREF